MAMCRDQIVHGTLCDIPDPGVPVAAFAASALYYMLEDFPCQPSTAFMPLRILNDARVDERPRELEIEEEIG